MYSQNIVQCKNKMYPMSIPRVDYFKEKKMVVMVEVRQKAGQEKKGALD